MFLRLILNLLLCSGLLTCLSCQRENVVSATLPAEVEDLPVRLSELGLFQGSLACQVPSAGVYPYELRTPLFSDYTLKYRFIKLPPGTIMTNQGHDEVLGFPVGTLIAKTFAYPLDQREPSRGQKLLETRILRRDSQGWSGVSYLWNEEQTEATQKLAGTVVPSKWVHFDGNERTNAYIVPNANQCKGCHGNSNDPIGPKPRNLSNHLATWQQAGLIQPGAIPAALLPVWNDESTGNLDQRARAWLDINCAHCHHPTGAARQSGLDLRYTQQDPSKLGIMKVPVAAGRGSGGRSFDIVPGKPDESILLYRLESTEPGIMMPELPRRLVDLEGVRLMRAWIQSLR